MQAYCLVTFSYNNFWYSDNHGSLITAITNTPLGKFILIVAGKWITENRNNRNVRSNGTRMEDDRDARYSIECFACIFVTNNLLVSFSIASHGYSCYVYGLLLLATNKLH